MAEEPPTPKKESESGGAQEEAKEERERVKSVQFSPPSVLLSSVTRPFIYPPSLYYCLTPPSPFLSSTLFGF